MVFSWSGDYATAAGRAEEAGIDINLEYHVPETGAPAWFDVWVIPDDAPHPENALLFLDYMMRPEVIADATNFTYYANANAASKPLVLPEILEDPAIYPDEEVTSRLFIPADLPPRAQRALTRAWSSIKTGQ
jgi:putrescine transport system substrate-binding protein